MSLRSISRYFRVYVGCVVAGLSRLRPTIFALSAAPDSRSPVSGPRVQILNAVILVAFSILIAISTWLVVRVALGILSYDAELVGIISSGNVEKANRVRDTLVSMIDNGDSKLVNVLYMVYSAQSPFAPHARFGQLAAIVSLTKAAEKVCGGKYVRDEFLSWHCAEMVARRWTVMS